MLQPKRTKFRKAVQGPHPRRCEGGTTLDFRRLSA